MVMLTSLRMVGLSSTASMVPRKVSSCVSLVMGTVVSFTAWLWCMCCAGRTCVRAGPLYHRNIASAEDNRQLVRHSSVTSAPYSVIVQNASLFNKKKRYLGQNARHVCLTGYGLFAVRVHDAYGCHLSFKICAQPGFNHGAYSRNQQRKSGNIREQPGCYQQRTGNEY